MSLRIYIYNFPITQWNIVFFDKIPQIGGEVIRNNKLISRSDSYYNVADESTVYALLFHIYGYECFYTNLKAGITVCLLFISQWSREKFVFT